jgi:hypothetical protein
VKEKYLLGMDAVLFLASRAEETFCRLANENLRADFEGQTSFVLKL